MFRWKSHQKKGEPLKWRIAGEGWAQRHRGGMSGERGNGRAVKTQLWGETQRDYTTRKCLRKRCGKGGTLFSKSPSLKVTRGVTRFLLKGRNRPYTEFQAVAGNAVGGGEGVTARRKRDLRKRMISLKGVPSKRLGHRPREGKGMPRGKALVWQEKVSGRTSEARAAAHKERAKGEKKKRRSTGPGGESGIKDFAT